MASQQTGHSEGVIAVQATGVSTVQSSYLEGHLSRRQSLFVKKLVHCIQSTEKGYLVT